MRADLKHKAVNLLNFVCIVILSIMMLVGCGNKEEVIQPETPTAEPIEVVNEKPKETVTEESVPETIEEVVEEEEETVFGIVSDDGYTNHYFGLHYSLEKDWHLWDEELLNQYKEDAEEMLQDFSGVYAQALNMEVVMYASSDDSSESISIGVAELPHIIATLSEDDLVGLTQGDLGSVLQEYMDEDETIEMQTVSLLGEDHVCVTMSQGKEAVQNVVFLKKDNWLCCITSTVKDKERLEEVLADFELISDAQ